MGEKINTLAEINRKLQKGQAVVLTAQEFKEMVRTGNPPSVGEVDVVTTATMGVMSGTMACFNIPITEPGKFSVAKEVYINGVPGYPGPAPNERLGNVDCIIYGTAHSRYDPNYGGGHLFKDMVVRRTFDVEIITDNGAKYTRTLTLDELSFARIYGIRHAFKNYHGFVNIKQKDRAYSTIFYFKDMEASDGVSISGCGELNPLQNDPDLQTTKMGTIVLVNGAIGIITGTGTRSTPQKPNISVSADMFKMNPNYMGGFKTSAGPEILSSTALAIPVLNEQILQRMINNIDENIPLPIADISDRRMVGEATYADIWRNVDLRMIFNRKKCSACTQPCPVERYCPVDAFVARDRKWLPDQCFGCGACISQCRGEAFTGNLGKIKLGGHEYPITFRQSDKKRAQELTEILKEKLLRGELFLSE